MSFVPSSLEQTRQNFVEKVLLGDVKSQQLFGLIQEILQISGSLTSRYSTIDVVKFLQDNCQNSASPDENIKAILAGLNILEKYGKNLLRPDRPYQWRIVRLSNPIFHAKVDNLKGTRAILMQMGYTHSIPDGLSYPSNSNLPELNIVSLVTSDIVLLKYELLMLQKGQHPNPQSILIYLNNSQHQSAPQFHSVQSRPSTSRTPTESSSTSNTLTNSNTNASLSTNTEKSIQMTNLPMDQICDVCGQKRSELYCQFCKMKQCKDCDKIWHQNQQRVTHKRNQISHLPQGASTQMNQSNSQQSGFNFSNPSVVGGGDSYNRPSDETIFDVSNENLLNDHVNRFLEMSDSYEKQQKVKGLLKSIDAQIVKYTDASERLLSSRNASKHFIEKSVALWEQKEGIESMFQSILSLSFPEENLVSVVDSIDIEMRVESWPSPYNGSGVNDENGDPPRMNTPVGEPPRINSRTGKTPKINSHTGEPPNVNFLSQKPLEVNLPSVKFSPSSVSLQSKSSKEIKVVENFLKKEIEPNQNNFSSEIRGPPSINYTPPASNQSSFNDQNIPTFSPNSPLFKPMEPLFPEVNFPFNPDLLSDMDLTLEEMQKKTEQESLRSKCLEMISFLRNAELNRYTPQHVEIAVNRSKMLKGISPLKWLKENWEKEIRNLTKKCQFATFDEASKMFLKAEGDPNKAFDLLMEIKTKKIFEVGLSQYCSNDEILDCLCKEKGNVRKTRESLEIKLSADFKQRLDSKIYKTEFQLALFATIEDRKHRNNALIAYCRIKDENVADSLFKVVDQTQQNKDDPSLFNECDLEDIVEACRAFPENIEGTLKYLQTECNICYETFPQSKVECLTACGENRCRYCRNCLATYLRIKVNEGNIRDMVCPVCCLPDIDEDEEVADTYFSKLDMVIKLYLEPEVHNLFQRKLRDSTLMKMPNFRWCFHCTYGFEYNEGNLKMVCSMCFKATCFNCKKGWEPQHEGISCQQFREWKELNDPNFQTIGLAAHLRENGIDCPKCKFKYALSKGGCMHFKCLKCSFHFCSGCQSPFKAGNVCNFSTKCSRLGLHAHHPRDCLFFLRDFEQDRLREILENANVPFDTQANTEQELCQVPEQKDTAEGGFEDAVCGVEVSCAGLCDVHYREYLVSLINRDNLDPALIYSVNELQTCLHRSEVEFPDQGNDQNDDDYKLLLLGLVKKLPLIKGNAE